jgi:pectin methylesterase-like acyl-CoA thioesterase
MSIRQNCALLAAGFALAFGVQPAGAKTLQVTNTASPCEGSDPTFTTIQSAVNAASKGDTVVVCQGTYPEQVSIIRGITLEGFAGQTATVAVPNGGVVQNATSIDPNNPEPAIAAQILVQPALPNTNVNIKNLVVDGTGKQRHGVRP